MATYLERYQAGEHEQVWAELAALGEAAVQEPLLADAEAVAREIMRRVLHNIELIIARLEEIGFQFGALPDDPEYWDTNPPLAKWTRRDAKAQAKLEAKAGPMPLSLRIFFEVVGSVNLIGLFPDWPHKEVADPLMIEAVSGDNLEHHLDNFEDWEFDQEEGAQEEDFEPSPFLMELAPDALQKADISGGEPYGIYLPASAADAVFQNERHETTFVNYLRICFQWGGFPGLEAYGEAERQLAHLETLKADLLPI